MSSDNRRSVFVVEDSTDIRDLISFLYETEGYPVEFAGDGADALDKLQAMAVPPCVILLDLMMPKMDGHKFRSEQKAIPKLAEIPVIIMSADANANETAKKMGAAGYIRKPMSAEVLLKVAEKFCRP